MWCHDGVRRAGSPWNWARPYPPPPAAGRSCITESGERARTGQLPAADRTGRADNPGVPYEDCVQYRPARPVRGSRPYADDEEIDPRCGRPRDHARRAMRPDQRRTGPAGRGHRRQRPRRCRRRLIRSAAAPISTGCSVKPRLRLDLQTVTGRCTHSTARQTCADSCFWSDESTT